MSDIPEQDPSQTPPAEPASTELTKQEIGRATINISGDTVTLNTAWMPEEQRDLVRWLYGWIKDSRKSWRDIQHVTDIHLKSNSGIEPSSPPREGEMPGNQNREAVTQILEAVPSRHRKKMFAIKERIEWLVKTYGIDHVGLMTLTIRENVTDRKEFQRRFKSIATNVFPKIYEDWIRVFERQQRGAWHAHVVVATKADIRTGTEVVTLNKLLKDHRDRKITKAEYYGGIQRMASSNLRAIWREFRRLCGVGLSKRQKVRERRYKFDACHLMPIISNAQALAVYVSKYIGKGFQNRRPEDKGMRLVGCTKRVAKVCGERFAWLGGAGSLWRSKLQMLAEMVRFQSMDDFARKLGSRWAYHIRPAVDALTLPRYANMTLARADGWNLVNVSDGSPWPWPDLKLPSAQFRDSQSLAFKLLTDLFLRRRRKRPGRSEKLALFKPPPKPCKLRQCEFELGEASIVKD